MRAKSQLPIPLSPRIPESRENHKVGGAEGREKGIRGRIVRAGNGQQRQKQLLAPSTQQPPSKPLLGLS